jgi:phage baseplate assembly protein W
MQKDNSFLGTGWSFPPTFNKLLSEGAVMVSKEEDIRQSLEILMNTRKGERVMLPEYGCDIHDFLFESINSSKMHLLQEMIRTAILTFEPRIQLHEVIIDHSEYLEGIIRVKLDYSIETSNTRFNLVFPYYQTEGTDVPKIYHRKVIRTIRQEEHK